MPRRRRRFPLLRWLFGVPFTLLGLALLAVVALRWLPPPTSAYMLQSPTQPVHQQWVPKSAIADYARRAVVASEDQKFFTHDGFDVEAIEKAYAENQKAAQRNSKRHPRGASTISQQTVKNLFLWPGGGYFRKGLEAGLTVLIEQFWNKQRILEMYLNIVEFGPGIYGVEAASQAFFGKSAAKLAPAEAARLAAVLPNPRRWNARAPGPYVQARTTWILGQMGYGAPAAEPEPEAGDAGASDDDEPSAGPPEVRIEPAPELH